MSDRSTVLLEHHLKELKLPTFLREYGKVAGQCAAEDVDHPGYLLRLSELELIDRHHRMVDRRIKAARFPATKSLDTFDFLAMPSVNKHLVMQLARCEYVDRRETVIAIGNSGTGKTHVPLGLELAACQRGLSVETELGAGVGAFTHWVPPEWVRYQEPKQSNTTSLALMRTTVLCYSATSGSAVADCGKPCRVDMGNVGFRWRCHLVRRISSDYGLASSPPLMSAAAQS